MPGIFLLLTLLALVLTALLGWWWGRRSSRPATASPILVASELPVGLAASPGSEEDQLHRALAQAAAAMVIPLETFFNCGVELNLKTAALTQELLAQFPPAEQEILRALQGNLTAPEVLTLAAKNQRTPAELLALQQRFQATAAAALLPKIKAGLSNEPSATPPTEPVEPIALTERLSLSTESPLVERWRKQAESVQAELERLSTTHVPQTRLDSLQDEYAQQRQVQAQLAQSVATLQAALAEQQAATKAAAATTPNDVAETLAELQHQLQAAQTTSQQHAAAQEEISQLQAALAAQQAATKAAAATTPNDVAETLDELKATNSRLAEELAGHGKTHVPLSHLTNLQMEFANLHSQVAGAAEERASLQQELESANAALAELTRSHGSVEQLTEDLEHAELAAREAREEAAESRAAASELEARLAAVQEGQATADQDLSDVRDALAEAEARHAALETELQAAQSGSQEQALAQEEISQLQANLHSQAAGAAEERARLQQELESAHTALAAATARHAALEADLQAAQAAASAPALPPEEAYEDLAQELRITRESAARLTAELTELKAAQEGIPTDTADLVERLRTLEEQASEAAAAQQLAESSTAAAQAQLAKLKADIEAQRQATVARADYEALRSEMEKSRNDLSTTLSRYATLQQRFNSIDKAASVERLKNGLAQEEKAHGALRIQYRNLENKLYEAVGGRKRYEAELKAMTKERDQLQTQVKAAERTAANRVKVVLPAEIANPTLPEETAENTAPAAEPAPPPKPKRRIPKAASASAEGDASEVPASI